MVFWNKLKPANLKLTERGLLLVACPLIIELVLVACLGWLINESDNEAKRLEHYRNVLASGANVVDDFYEATHSLLMYGIKRRDPFFDETYVRALVRLTEGLEDLTDKVAGNEEQRKALGRVTVCLDKGIENLDETKRKIDGGTVADGGLSLVAYSFRLELTSDKLIESMRDFTNVVNATERVTPESGMVLRWWLWICLIGAALTAVWFIVLSLSFYRHLTQRLGTLLDNTQRLEQNKPLNDPIKGTDEVAHLDGVFHNMAASLAEASRKERAVVENAVDVICSISADGTFLRVNPASLAVFGYERDALIGRSMFDIIEKTDQAATREALDRIKQSETATSFESRVQRQDGRLAYILWAAHWSASDECWFCVAHDISDRKEVEQLREQFISMVSHDLRTPLTSVQSFFGLLNDGVYGEVQQIVLDRSKLAETNVVRLIRLVNDLLDTEKIEAGRLTMNRTDEDVNRIFRSATEAVRGFADQQEVLIKMQETDLRVFADGDRLVQVLVNLLGNAIKFSDARKMVSLTAGAVDGDLIEMQVRDEGRGIPASHRHLIFDRYEQVEAGDAVRKGGAGLGLAISRAIVEAHGGSIGVQSEEGKGSVFWIRIAASSSITLRRNAAVDAVE